LDRVSAWHLVHLRDATVTGASGLRASFLPAHSEERREQLSESGSEFFLG